MQKNFAHKYIKLVAQSYADYKAKINFSKNNLLIVAVYTFKQST